MFTIRFCTLLVVFAIAAVQGYEKSKIGTNCEIRALEIKTESECKQACASLSYRYLGSWNGPNDFPGCTFTEGFNRVCHFNTNSNPDRKLNCPNCAKYAAICKKCEDTATGNRCQNQGITNNRCITGAGGNGKKWARQTGCLATCGYCDPNYNAATYEKAAKGSFCNPQTNQLTTEAECRTACNELGYTMDGNHPSWNGPGDFPACLYTEGLNRVCHFNTSPNPATSIQNVPAPGKTEYAAICKKA